MSNAKHTPGPWEVGRYSHVVLPPTGLPASWTGCHAVCRVYGDDVRRPANAHLIAAAPDLLEALQNLMTRVQYDKDAKHWFTDEQKAARAAITKAKGGGHE